MARVLVVDDDAASGSSSGGTSTNSTSRGGTALSVSSVCRKSSALVSRGTPTRLPRRSEADRIPRSMRATTAVFP